MSLGYVLILAAALSWGFIGIFGRLVFSEGISPMEVAFWRALIAWGFFGLQAVIRGKTSFAVRDIPYLLIFSQLGITLFYVSYQMAVKLSGAAFAAVMLYTAPVWVILFSYFLFREKLTLIKSAAVVLVISGVALMVMTAVFATIYEKNSNNSGDNAL